jgi:hypothetical protein
LLGELLTRGNTGLWCSAKDFAALNPERDEQDRVYIDRLCSAQVLVMDDLFSEGNFRAEWPRNVADRRYRRAFVTLFTSMRPPRATAQERERGIVGALEIDSDLASRACSGLRIERKGVDQRFVKRTA